MTGEDLGGLGGGTGTRTVKGIDIGMVTENGGCTM